MSNPFVATETGEFYSGAQSFAGNPFDEATWAQAQTEMKDQFSRKDYMERRLTRLVEAQIQQQPRMIDMKPGVRRQVIRDMVEVAAEIMAAVDNVAEKL